MVCFFPPPVIVVLLRELAERPLVGAEENVSVKEVSVQASNRGGGARRTALSTQHHRSHLAVKVTKAALRPDLINRHTFFFKVVVVVRVGGKVAGVRAFLSTSWIKRRRDVHPQWRCHWLRSFWESVSVPPRWIRQPRAADEPPLAGARRK